VPRVEPATVIMTPVIASPDPLAVPGRRATRYARGMPEKRKGNDPLYTTPRYTTAQVAEILGIDQKSVQSAIARGTLESELLSPRLRVVSQAAIDAYRERHLGQVGHPTRKKQRLTRKAKEAKAAIVAETASPERLAERDARDSATSPTSAVEGEGPHATTDR